MWSMRKLAAGILLVSLLVASAAPVYARHHVNKEARAAQKRNKARAKERKKEVRALQKSSTRSTAHQ